jgi:hypothetical protein
VTYVCVCSERVSCIARKREVVKRCKSLNSILPCFQRGPNFVISREVCAEWGPASSFFPHYIICSLIYINVSKNDQPMQLNIFNYLLAHLLTYLLTDLPTYLFITYLFYLLYYFITYYLLTLLTYLLNYLLTLLT